MSEYISYYTHEQIAQKLGVKHTAIRYLIESGKLKHHSGRWISDEYGVRYVLAESEIEKARELIKELDDEPSV